MSIFIKYKVRFLVSITAEPVDLWRTRYELSTSANNFGISLRH